MLTATTRSTNTVSPNVTSRMTTSAGGARRTILTKCRASLMFQATTNRMAASAASGTCTASGASEQNDEHQRQRMHDAGERAGAAVAHVRRGAGDRAGRREAAEQRRDDVGDALPDQLLIGVVARARHAVGDDGRQQRLDRAEHRDGERRPDQLDHPRGGDLRQLQRRQAARECRRRPCRSWQRLGSCNVACSEGRDHQTQQRPGTRFSTASAA